MCDRKTSDSIALGLEDLLQYAYFPLIAEVVEDSRILSSTSSQKKFQNGDLLWLLRYCQDEDTGKRAVRVCRFDAPNHLFPVVIDGSLKVCNRDYADVRNQLADMKGPLMDISELANFAKDPERPVFAVTSDDYANKKERILIHGKEKTKGYLAKGKRGHLLIPVSFGGPFVETKPSSSPVTVSICMFLVK